MSESNFLDLMKQTLQVCFKEITQVLFPTGTQSTATLESTSSASDQNSQPLQKTPPQEPSVPQTSTLPDPKTPSSLPSKSLPHLSPCLSLENRELLKKMLKERPKHPINSFMFFVEEMKKGVCQENQGKKISVSSMHALASQKWKEMSQEAKQPYFVLYNQQHKHYLLQMQTYIQKYPILESILTKAKRITKEDVYKVMNTQQQQQTPTQTQTQTQRQQQQQMQRHTQGDGQVHLQTNGHLHNNGNLGLHQQNNGTHGIKGNSTEQQLKTKKITNVPKSKKLMTQHIENHSTVKKQCESVFQFPKTILKMRGQTEEERISD